jgi:hypothetical protein
MLRLVGVILLLLPALPAAAAEDKPKDKPDTPAEQYQALLKEYQNDAKDAKTPQERMQLGPKYAPKFLELAEKNPKDPAAADALAWVVTNTNVNSRERDERRAKALELLTREHADSPKVGPALPPLARAYDKESGDFLRAVLDKNPSRDLQGQACLTLAQYLKNRDLVLDALKQRPDVAKILEGMVGKEYTDELKKMDPAKAQKETEQLFDRAADTYGDVKVGGQKIADLPDLFEIKHLSVGKEAPEIEGEDLDGKKLKLSDYRGKVVLLDFWGNW